MLCKINALGYCLSRYWYKFAVQVSISWFALSTNICKMDLFGRGIQQPTSKQTSSLSTIQFLWCQFEEFGIESIFNPQIDIFVFHITSTLVVHWSCKKKFCLGQVKNNDLVLPHLSFLQAWSCGTFYTSLGPTWAFLIEDLFMESGFLLPAGCNPSYSIRFVQNYVELLNKP